MNAFMFATAISMFALAVVTAGILFLIVKDSAQALFDKKVSRMVSIQTTLDQPSAVLVAHSRAPRCEAKMPSLAELYVS